MKHVFLALGSNVGNRRSNIEAACVYAADFFEILSKSKIYETEPVGYINQRDFLNAAVFGRTELEPEEFFDACKLIEAKLGRKPQTFKDAPREIDLDIIFFEGVSINTPKLIIPHPRWAERDFVISPLLDLLDAGNFELPHFEVHKEFLAKKIRKSAVFCAFGF